MPTLATKAELETFVEAEVPEARANLVLELATSAVLNVAEASVFETTEQVTVDGTGAPSLLLPSWPVTDVAEVLVHGDEVDGYEWSRTGELRRTSGVWPASLRSIEVTYTHGYPEAEIPKDLKTVCLQAAARGLTNPVRLNSFTAGGGGDSTGFGGGGTGVLVLELYASEAAMVQRALR